jgi:hypothetical protein
VCRARICIAGQPRAARTDEQTAAVEDVPEDLLAVLRTITDPRCQRGVRHQQV